MRAEAGVVSASRVGLRDPAAASSGTVYPNDTYFEATNNGANGDQWYLWLIDAEDAWGYGQGKVPVAVIDTGYDPQQTEIAPLVTLSETIVNLTVYANTATDTDGHGTFLSSVAGAQDEQRCRFRRSRLQRALAGVQNLRRRQYVGADDHEAAAIRAAVGNGAKVILLASRAARRTDRSDRRDAVAYAIANNVTVVAAAATTTAPPSTIRPPIPA